MEINIKKLLKSEKLIMFSHLIIIIVLVILDIIFITTISIISTSQDIVMYVSIFDLIAVLILIPDFIIRYKKAENKKNFLKYNFIDILGMIPEISIGPYTTTLDI